MAVIPMWKCDRDGSMFSDKKAAEEHDKMLELAANITMLLEQTYDNIDEKIAEDIGLLFAKHKETLAKAIKGKPELVLEIGKESAADQSADEDSSE
ncbi:YebG family protein [Endozoicomonas sp. SM1973]|uniref:YebG family protein n=1 Tax=Spartinivicinus marinus TaxID=2994442 RepID=A0A853IBX7_9GAMM|nr:YebG family protein [Spartinivicinus marinus]MCX4028761.1 YebG family protein [Spartinivicinus marinus]NYZ67574.1 YebG family protein [Spartinivicinus marinus]